MSEDLGPLRSAIDRLDAEILERLNERARIAREIGRVKGDTAAWRPEREAQVLRRVQAAGRGPLAPEAVASVFREIMAQCLALERAIRVAFLGPVGTFTESAARKAFGSACTLEPEATLDAVFRAGEAGSADYCVVPVENSTEGAVGRTLDLMVQTPLSVCAEVELPIHQNLLAAPGGDAASGLAAVRRVYSHAQSLGQCQGWLNTHLPGVPRVQVDSNAEAARRASVEPDAAAVAGEEAARRWGLSVLAARIEDDPNNTTRFWVLGRQAVAPSGRDKTSLVMSAPNRPGAVHELLGPLARHGVSMTRLESRPAKVGGWEYLFFVDLEGHREEPAVDSALAELRRLAPFLKLLGSYPAAAH